MEGGSQTHGWLAGQPAGQPTMYLASPMHFESILMVLVYYWIWGVFGSVGTIFFIMARIFLTGGIFFMTGCHLIMRRSCITPKHPNHPNPIPWTQQNQRKQQYTCLFEKANVKNTKSNRDTVRLPPTIPSSRDLAAAWHLLFATWHFFVCHLAVFVCHLAIFVCHLLLSFCHLTFFVCHLAVFVCHLTAFVCHLPFFLSATWKFLSAT